MQQECLRVGVSRCGPAAVVGRGVRCFVGVNLSSSSSARRIVRVSALVEWNGVLTDGLRVNPNPRSISGSGSARTSPLARGAFLVAKDVKRSTPTQQPTIPWSSLLRQRPRQCSTLQLTQQDWENYQEISCSLSVASFAKDQTTKRRHGDPCRYLLGPPPVASLTRISGAPERQARRLTRSDGRA